MRIPIAIVLVVTLVVLAAVVFVGLQVLQPERSLIVDARFTLEKITPNADGNDDITQFSYTLSRDAVISLTFTGANGSAYVFRQEERRIADDYTVLFSGVVQGYVLPDEAVQGEILNRLLPNGSYTWRLSAEAQNNGGTDERTGTLVIENADSPLPDISEFTISPTVFTPNQDGISDRAAINVYLTKDADLTVYLIGPNDEQIFVSERQEDARPGEAGRRLFDYEGGVDLNADPPPDGTYTVVALAQDAEGQRIQRTGSLTLQTGGKPLASIVAQPVGVSVVFEDMPYDARHLSEPDAAGELVAMPADPQQLSLTAITMPVGDMLVFKLTVQNYSDVPIRTSGPEPGTVYQQDQRASTLGWYDEAGAWRVGIDCDTAPADYPWRWAVGNDANLVEAVDPDTGNTYRYLPAGETSVVWGAIRMTDIKARNPQSCWAGLIHEEVEISESNARVGPREIELVEVGS